MIWSWLQENAAWICVVWLLGGLLASWAFARRPRPRIDTRPPHPRPCDRAWTHYYAPLRSFQIYELPDLPPPTPKPIELKVVFRCELIGFEPLQRLVDAYDALADGAKNGMGC